MGQGVAAPIAAQVGDPQIGELSPAQAAVNAEARARLTLAGCWCLDPGRNVFEPGLVGISLASRLGQGLIAVKTEVLKTIVAELVVVPGAHEGPACPGGLQPGVRQVNLVEVPVIRQAVGPDAIAVSGAVGQRR